MRITLILLLSVTSTFAQDNSQILEHKKDSITELLTKKQKISLDGHRLLCNYYNRKFDVDTLGFVINDYLKAAIKENNHNHIVTAKFTRGIYFAKQNIIDSALIYFKEVYKSENIKFSLKQNSLTNIGICYRLLRKRDSSILYLKEGLKLAKEEGRKSMILNSYLAVSNIYGEIENHSKKIIYLDSAFEYLGKNNNKIDGAYLTEINLLHSLGHYSYEIDEYNQAIKYYKLSRLKSIEYGVPYNLLQANNSIALAYIDLKKYDSALYYVNENLSHNTFNNNDGIISRTYRRLGLIEYTRGNFKKSLNHFDEAFNYVMPKTSDYYTTVYYRSRSLFKMKKTQESLKTLNLIDDEDINYKVVWKKDYYKLKYQIQLELKQYDSIKSNIENYIIAKDSLNYIKRSKIISNFQVNYETEKKEKENLLLKQKNLEEENKNQSLSNKLILTILILVLVILLLLIMFLYHKGAREKLKEKAEVKLSENKDQLNEMWAKIGKLNLNPKDNDQAEIIKLSQNIFDLFDSCYPNFRSKLEKAFPHWSISEKQLKLSKIYSMRWSDSETIVATRITASKDSLKHLKSKVKTNLAVNTDDQMFIKLSDHIK